MFNETFRNGEESATDKISIQPISEKSPFSESTSAFSINISRNLLHKFQTITYGNVRNNFRLLVFKEMCPNCVWTQNQRGVFNVKTFHAKCKYEKLNTFQQICSLNSCTLHVLFRTHTHNPREKKKKNKSLIGMKMWVNRDETGVEAVTFRW